MKPADDRSVLIIAPHPFFTERGTPIAVRDIASILTEAGWAVTILTFPFGEDPRLDGVEVIRVGRVPFVRRVGIGLNAGKIMVDIFLWFKLLRVLLRRRFAVYHAVEDSVFMAYAASRIFPAHLVYDMDSCMGDQIVEKFPKLSRCRRLFRCAEKFVMRRADHILPVCPALGKTCDELAPSTPKTILHDVPPIPAESKPGDLLDLRAIAGEGNRIALYAGNFELYQGVDLLIGAMEQMDPDVPLRILLAGGGDRIDALRERVEQGPARGRVLFVGPQPLHHLPHLLQQADILLSPRCQGVNTPMKIYAYLAAGKAILATRILSHTQIMGEEECFWVDPDERAIAGGLTTLIDADSLRESLGSAGAALWRARYSHDSLRQKVVAAYEELPRS